MFNSADYKPLTHESIVKNEILKIHGKFKQFVDADFYPEHENRTTSTEYAKIRQKIVHEQNAACVMCGVTSSILSDPNKRADEAINYYQAKVVELHHFHIEWALANAIDLDKFNNLFRPHLANLHPECQLYKTYMNQDMVLEWVDHHQHNLMPLCDVHHRHKYYGIHHVTYPSWTVSNLYKDDFIENIKEKIDDKA